VYDRAVINSGQLVNGLWMGSVLILIALAPGLIQGCMDAVRHLSTTSSLRLFPFPQRMPATFEPPRWLAWAGVAIWLTAALAYLA
jgi:hypothetical protein